MGNILGFIIPIALLVTQPQLFVIAFRYLGRGASAALDFAATWNELLKSILAGIFLRLAICATMVELALAYFIIGHAMDEVPWQAWILFAFLVVAQLAWALFNYLTATCVVTRTKLGGKDTTYCEPKNAWWGKYRSYSHPFTWLAVTSVAFLAQGGLLEYYALTAVDSYSAQRGLILLAFLSKMMYGMMAIFVASVIGWLLVKSTRFLKRTSTVIAKIIVSIDLNIEFNKNALQEIGGEIDILDEEYVAGKIKYLFTVLFVPIIVFDLAIFIWPSQLIAIVVLFSIVAVGLLEFVFGSMSDEAAVEAKESRVKRMRVIFNVMPYAGIAFIILAFGLQTAVGRNLMVELENLWFGVSYIALQGFWFSLLLASIGLLVAYLARLGARITSAYALKKEQGPVADGSWGVVVGYASKGLWGLTALCVIGSVFMVAGGFLSCAGVESLRFSPDIDQYSVLNNNTRVNGRALPKQIDATWHVKSATSVSGVVILAFDTPIQVDGHVEYTRTRQEFDDTVNTIVQPQFAEVADGVTGLFRNQATFNSRDPLQEIRIVLNQSVAMYNVTVNSREAKAIPHQLWQPPDPDSQGRVVIEFTTREKAYGVIEFVPPSAALAVDMPSYIPLVTKEISGSGYSHKADFQVSPKFQGEYRLVMRNAGVESEANPYTGLVSRTATQTIEAKELDLAFYERWWIGLKDWWAGLWSDDGNNKRRPERTVVVIREPPPKPPRTFTGSSRQPDCGSGCKITPLKVEPELATEVAAARARR